jgi:hypothetical protein
MPAAYYTYVVAYHGDHPFQNLLRPAPHLRLF